MIFKRETSSSNEEKQDTFNSRTGRCNGNRVIGVATKLPTSQWWNVKLQPRQRPGLPPTVNFVCTVHILEISIISTSGRVKMKLRASGLAIRSFRYLPIRWLSIVSWLTVNNVISTPIRNLVVRGGGRHRRPLSNFLHRAVRHAGAGMPACQRAWTLP